MTIGSGISAICPAPLRTPPLITPWTGFTVTSRGGRMHGAHKGAHPVPPRAFPVRTLLGHEARGDREGGGRCARRSAVRVGRARTETRTGCCGTRAFSPLRLRVTGQDNVSWLRTYLSLETRTYCWREPLTRILRLRRSRNTAEGKIVCIANLRSKRPAPCGAYPDAVSG